MATISTDNIGGGYGGYGGGYGDGFGNGWFMWIFAILVIFFVMWRRDDRHHDKGLESALPALAPMLYGHGHKNKMDDCGEARIWHDLAEEAGKTRHDIDHQTYQLQRSMDEQTSQIKEKIGYSIENQNRLAMEAERMHNQRWMEEMRDRVAERDRLLVEKNSQLLAQESINNTNTKYCMLQNELTQVKDKMLKAPQYIPFGGVAASNPCVPPLAYA